MAKAKKISSVAGKPSSRIKSQMSKTAAHKPGTLADTLRRTKTDSKSLASMYSTGRKK